MSRVATAYDHRMSASEAGHRLHLTLGLSGTELDTKRKASIRTFAAPLRKLKRALERSTQVMLTPGPVKRDDGMAEIHGGTARRPAPELEAAAPADPATHPARRLVAFISARNAHGDALDFITREAARRDADMMEFRTIGELLDHLKNGGVCDLALLDWDTLGHEAFQSVQQCPAITSQIAFVAMTGQPEGAAIADARAETTTPGVDDEGSSILNPACADDGTKASQPAMPTMIRGALKLDFRTGRAFWKDHPVELTVTQFNIVHLLARHIGENLTYRQIYDIVHKPGFHAGDGEDGYQTNVRSLIKRIRQQFRAADRDFAEIENHRSVGYRWRVAEMTALETTDAHIANVPPDDSRIPTATGSRWLKLMGAVGKTRAASQAAAAARIRAPVTDPLE